MKSNKTIVKKFYIYKNFYIMLIPVLVFYLVFCYAPMYGIILAFKTYTYNGGIMGSPWIGLQHFKELINDFQFRAAFRNTVFISLGKLLFTFPMPIIFAILLNEILQPKIKRVYQTVFTFPHFISWVVMSGIIITILSQNGAVNQLLGVLGFKAINPLIDTKSFRPLLYVSYIWKEMGWESVIYLAALAGINPELYEACIIDGATRFQRILYVTWPGIRSTVAILLILAIGQVMQGGGATTGSSFDQIFNLYNPSVYSVADTIDTYIYRTTFTTGADFGYMTAIGLIKSVINLLLLSIANYTVKKMGETGLY